MGQVFAWICLLVVASTTAYGLQLTATAIMRPPAAAAEVASATPTRKVLIVAVDAVTDERTQVECETPVSTFASDVLVVETSDFPAIIRGCNRADTLAVAT